MRLPPRRVAAALAPAVSLVVLSWVGWSVTASAARQAPAAAPPGASSAGGGDLATLFDTGRLLVDRNGDGTIDGVNARMTFAGVPDAGDVSAASDLAARLGYETSAMDLPLTAGGAVASTIAFGGQTGPEVFWATSPAAADEGVISATSDAAAPVRVTGTDADGVRAAARAVAARLPHVWDPKGPTLAGVKSDVTTWLGQQGVTGATVSVPGASVRGSADQFETIAVRVVVSDAVVQAKTVAALRALALPRQPAPTRGTATSRRTPTAAATPPATSSAGAPTLSYRGTASLTVRVEAGTGAPVIVAVPRAAADAPSSEPPARRPGGGAKDNFDLSTLYSIDGGLGDSDSNLIPDRVDVLLTPGGEGTEGTIDLAARLGLESTGVALPIARPAAEVTRPDGEPMLVIIGTSHPLIDRLVEQKKLDRPALTPGEGLLRVVTKAFGEKHALVITGGDPRGLARALDQAATRFPHLWPRGKDRPTVDDVEEETRRTLSGRTPVGQAATALYKLERLAREIGGRDLASVQASVFVEKPARGLDAVVKQVVGPLLRNATLDVTVESLDVQEAKPISVNGRPISETFEVASEVDAFWQVLRTKVVPGLKKKQPITVHARLSEPPEIRRAIEQQAKEMLVKAGAAPDGTTVTVLSAYKQGFSWLNDQVLPALAGKPVERIVIRFAEAGPPPEWKQQAMFTPTRWLMEIFPIDEILARELRIGLDRISFEKLPVGSTTYEVVATGAGGTEILRQTFEPTFVVRPYFDRFPDYERVRVTTGWITAAQAGRSLVDERIVTDVERFWDHFQGTTLPAIYDYVMAQTDGKPRASEAPHFGELRVELTLSEPDYPLGVDKEQIAPMEAMHEEIYFGVLHFFDVLGRNARGQALDYPGRVIPVVRPKKDGKAGEAKITFTGFGAKEPSVVLSFTERGGAKGRRDLPVPKVALDRPSALAAHVRAGQEGLTRLDLRVKVDTDRDEREALVRRARAERVDETMISAEQVEAVLGHVGRLRAAGLYRDALAWQGLAELRLQVGLTFDPALSEKVVTLASNGAPAPLPDIRTLLPAGWKPGGGPLVQWETPIPPPEANELLAKMSTFPGTSAYKVGRSYLGKDIWAMDVMPPVAASHWSQAKATTLKPTVIYSARQHANEVSSTSHTLKLAELLLTDPAWKKKLDRVNVVFHPITNADGAQLAYDLYKITPDHMLHAGYLGSLGVDVMNNQWDQDPIYPESSIRPKLWRTWLPDIFLNPHGYPSHEWVQLFSEYAGWVRNRATESRDWWGMRGWFTPGFGFVDDPKYPRHKDAAFEIRDRFTKAISAAPDVKALNERAYARYRRYGIDHDDENFKMDLTNGVLVYSALKGSRASATNQDFMARNPAVTIWTGSTEAPDETAYGDWMKLVATAGLQWDKAILDYLYESPYEVERRREPFAGGVSFSTHRARPPKPKGGDGPTTR